MPRAPRRAAALARKTPKTALDHLESWSGATPAERRRRAMRAIRDNDEAELLSLVDCHLGMFSKRGIDVSPHTRRTYHTAIRNLMAWTLNHTLKLHELEQHHILRWRAHLQGAGASPATTNHRLAAARRFLEAIRWAGCTSPDAAPTNGCRVIDPTPPADKRIPFTRTEVDSLLLHATNPRDRALMLLGADAGLRISEALALEHRDVDVPNRRLRVRHGKGGRSATVRLTPRLAAALRPLWLPTPAKDVFSICERRLRDVIAELCDRADIPRRPYHSLRHSCGTELYRRTRDLLLVAKHLRHADITTTAIYAHLADTDLDAAIAALR